MAIALRGVINTITIEFKNAITYYYKLKFLQSSLYQASA